MQTTVTKAQGITNAHPEEPRMNPRRKAVGKASAMHTVVAKAQGHGQGIANAQHRHQTKAQGPRMQRGTPDEPKAQGRGQGIADAQHTATEPRHKGHGCTEEPRMTPW